MSKLPPPPLGGGSAVRVAPSFRRPGAFIPRSVPSRGRGGRPVHPTPLASPPAGVRPNAAGDLARHCSARPVRGPALRTDPLRHAELLHEVERGQLVLRMRLPPRALPMILRVGRGIEVICRRSFVPPGGRARKLRCLFARRCATGLLLLSSKTQPKAVKHCDCTGTVLLKKFVGVTVLIFVCVWI